MNKAERSALLFFLWDDELVALAVDVDDFYLIIGLQMLTQLCDVNIHGAGIEIVVINPDSLQGIIALQYFV